MQWALNTWSELIWATRGALVSKKTFWYTIDFSWHEGTWEYTSQEDLLDNLEMNDPSGQVQTVERLDMAEAL